MADLSDINSAGVTKVVGSDASGVEQTPVQATSGGALHANLRDSAGAEITKSNPIATRFGDTSDMDAFGRLRVSNPEGVFEATFPFDKLPLLFSELGVTGGTITHDVNKASVLMNTTTASGSKATFQSRRYLKYHPGKSQKVTVTGNFNAGVTNVRRRLGQFDNNNGLFFEQVGTTFNVVMRSSVSGSVVDTAVAKASWNLDPLDGTGSSGITLDITKQQIFIIDYQWLGSGRIRFGFSINGITIYCHQFLNSNAITVPWAQTASLPIRAEQENLAGLGGVPTPIHMTCVEVTSEGGYAPEGIVRSINNGTTAKALAGATPVPIISLRKASSFLTPEVRLSALSFLANTADDLLVSIVVNGTLTGASWASAGGICERDVTASAITGGTTVYSFYVRGSAGSPSTQFVNDIERAANLILGSDLASVSDIVSITAASISGAATCFAAIVYKEII